eukprot:1017684-Pelagomonas_calceolata.AAC.4
MAVPGDLCRAYCFMPQPQSAERSTWLCVQHDTFGYGCLHVSCNSLVGQGSLPLPKMQQLGWLSPP